MPKWASYSTNWCYFLHPQFYFSSTLEFLVYVFVILMPSRSICGVSWLKIILLFFPYFSSLPIFLAFGKFCDYPLVPFFFPKYNIEATVLLMIKFGSGFDCSLPLNMFLARQYLRITILDEFLLKSIFRIFFQLFELNGEIWRHSVTSYACFP